MNNFYTTIDENRIKKMNSSKFIKNQKKRTRDNTFSMTIDHST